MELQYLLALDLGTSAIKMLAMDRDMDVLAVKRIVHSARNVTPTPLDVDDWLRAFAQQTRSLAGVGTLEAIVVTGQMHGLVPEYDDGVGEGIPWTDQRGAVMLPELHDLFGRELPSRIGGQLASGFQAVSLAWMKRHRPNQWSRLQRISLPKDAIIHHLTGRHVTDPSDAVGTGMYDPLAGDWAWDVVDALGVSHAWLPEVVPSGSVVGPVTEQAARAFGIRSGTPVIIAGGDAAAGAIGANITRSGQALVLLSTGAQIIQPLHGWGPDPQGRWYTWPSALPPGCGLARFLRVGTLLNAGLALEWLRKALDDPQGNLFDLSPGEPTGILLLPHLIGERTPLTDPQARAAMLGLSDSHTRKDIARSMLEGIAFALRHALETMKGDEKSPATIRLGGGGASNATWQQIITDVLGIPTERIGTPDLSAYGAALLGARALGWVDFDEWSQRRAASTVVTPDPKRRDHYNDLYDIYRDAVRAVSPISRRLVAWREPQS